MKSAFLFAFLIVSLFAVTFADIDRDGIPDEDDVCPRVYARTENGCPKISSTPAEKKLNSCLLSQLSSGNILAIVSPVCTE